MIAPSEMTMLIGPGLLPASETTDPKILVAATKLKAGDTTLAPAIFAAAFLALSDEGAVTMK
jgi:hypothetical protein